MITVFRMLLGVKSIGADSAVRTTRRCLVLGSQTEWVVCVVGTTGKAVPPYNQA
jgi:hypothetical protein